MPILDAPSEAEAQCAALCGGGLVYGIATEDMDALTFGTPRLIRNLMSPTSANKPILEIEYDKVSPRRLPLSSMGDGLRQGSRPSQDAGGAAWADTTAWQGDSPMVPSFRP